MIKIHVFIICLLLTVSGCKTKKDLTGQIVESIDRSFLFPLDWIGKYEGSLYVFDGWSDSTRIDMALYIDYPNAEGYYPWTLVYGEDDYRYYGLEVVDPDRGHYRIDEYNSIKLDAYLRENHFISRFSVKDSDIIVDYEKTQEGINVYFTITGHAPVSTSGGEIFGRDTVPLVNSYPVSAYQKAVLIKTED